MGRISLKDLHGCSTSGSKNDCLRDLAEIYRDTEDQNQTFQVETVMELDEKN